MSPAAASAASPDHGHNIFELMLAYARHAHPTVASGRFGADMQVSLTNDGPVTFILD